MIGKQGYVTIAITEKEINAVKHLASTIKKHDNNDRKFVVMTDDYDKVSIHNQIDYVLKLSYENYANHLKLNNYHANINLWQIYYSDLFEQTVYMAPFSLCNGPLDFLWQATKYDDIRLVDFTLNIDNSIVDAETYELFSKNNLKEYFDGLVYFKKSKKSAIFFKLLDIITQNWHDVLNVYIKEKRNLINDKYLLSLAMAIINKMTGDLYTYDKTMFSYVELSERSLIVPKDNTIESIIDIWHDDEFSLQINNYTQSNILNYDNVNINLNNQLTILNV